MKLWWKPRRRRLVLVIGGLALMGCQPYVGGVEGSPQVALWGDSITTDATPALKAAFEPDYATALWSFPGIVVSQAFEEATSQIQFDPPDAYVIELGINNIRDGDIDDSDREDIGHLADIVHPSGCVVWVNAATRRPALVPLVAQLNATLATLPTERAWVKVADWSSVALAHPEWFREGGVHYTPTGIDSYVAWLHGEVERLCEIEPR